MRTPRGPWVGYRGSPAKRRIIYFQYNPSKFENHSSKHQSAVENVSLKVCFWQYPISKMFTGLQNEILCSWVSVFATLYVVIFSTWLKLFQASSWDWCYQNCILAFCGWYPDCGSSSSWNLHSCCHHHTYKGDCNWDVCWHLNWGFSRQALHNIPQLHPIYYYYCFHFHWKGLA